MSTNAAPDAQAPVVIERTYAATLDEVWDLWTTPEGIEAWWGPDGFAVAVRALDLRAGGALRYAMTATGPDQVAFMERAGMPLTNELTLRFTEVLHPRRLAYRHVADFIPGVAPYEVGTLLELSEEGSGVLLHLTLQPMHDEEWTRRAVAGWRQELGALGAVLARRRLAG